MVIRSEQTHYYKGLASSDPARMLLGPRGKRPGAGDDSDMALCGFDLGLGVGRFPELELTHLIPSRKLNLEYLEQLHEGMGYGNTILSSLYSRTDNYPGQLQCGRFRSFLLFILMLATGTNRTERRIRIARERGRRRAMRDLNIISRQA